MSSGLVDISTAVLSAIEDKRDNTTAWPSKSRWSGSPGFILSSFESSRTWFPYTHLEDFPTGGKVWVVGLGSDDERSESRTNTSKRMFPVQVSLQVQITDPKNATLIDPWVELHDQLREVCRLEVDPNQENFSWMNNEAMKDDNGTPFSFMGLREGAFFEAFFTTHYQSILA